MSAEYWLSAIKAVERGLSDKFRALKLWSIGIVVAVVIGFAGVVTTLSKVNQV